MRGALGRDLGANKGLESPGFLGFQRSCGWREGLDGRDRRERGDSAGG